MTAIGPGSHVLCIGRAPRWGVNGYGDEVTPQIGQVYTVRDFELDEIDGTPCITLVEIVNPIRQYTHRQSRRQVVGEPSWDIQYFRPLDGERLGVFRQKEQEKELV